MDREDILSKVIDRLTDRAVDAEAKLLRIRTLIQEGTGSEYGYVEIEDLDYILGDQND